MRFENRWPAFLRDCLHSSSGFPVGHDAASRRWYYWNIAGVPVFVTFFFFLAQRVAPQPGLVTLS